MSILQPAMDLKNALSLTILNDGSESVKTCLYGTVKSKAEVFRYLLQVEDSILRVFSPAVRPAYESLLDSLLSTRSTNSTCLSVSQFWEIVQVLLDLLQRGPTH